MQRKIVVLCDYPCAGKSEVSDFFINEFGFLRTGSDLRRHMIFGTESPRITDHDEWQRDYNLCVAGMVYDRDLCLHYGDVVCDSTSMRQSTRDMLFKTPSGTTSESFLLHLDVSREEIERRTLAK